LLPDTPENRRYAGKYLEVYQFPEGRIQIREAGVSLPYSTYDKLGAIDGGVYCENVDVARAVPADSTQAPGVRPWAVDAGLAERLWHLSERLAGVTFFT
jgi:hypothetical protein